MNIFEKLGYIEEKNIPPVNKKEGEGKITPLEKDIIANRMVRISNEKENPLSIHIRRIMVRFGEDSTNTEKISDEDLKILLTTNLESEDFIAYKNVIDSGIWNEKSAELNEYEKRVAEWEKREMQNNAVNPKINFRRNFATILRYYLINKAIEEKLKERDQKASSNK